MLERKNIDRVFQENLRDLEINPSKSVWNSIELHLTEKPRKETIPLWQRFSGVAVILLMFFTGGFWYYGSNSNPTNNLEESISNSNFNGGATDKSGIVDPMNTNNLAEIVEINGVKINDASRKVKSPVFVKKPNNNVIITSTDISSIYKTIDNKYVVDESEFLQSLKANENSISNIDPVNINELPKKPMKSNWSVGTIVAPVYYNTLQTGSPISEELANNAKASENALSVGVKLNYKITDKFNVQSGVNKVELSYITRDVSATSSVSKIPTNNNITKSGIVLSSTDGQNGTIKSSSNIQSKSNVSGELNQSIEYYELPIEMKYNLYESKFGIGLVGGFSTFVLTKNSVSMISQNIVTDLGGASNLNSVNFSGNVGVDFDYKINKNWFLNVAPMFKYQFNTYSSGAGNFQPYYFGVYSGLNYRF